MTRVVRTYLDYNATAPLRPQAREAMLAALDAAGNPSSVHAEGRRARAIVEAARETVAALVGARPSEVIFTSGATEAASTVLHRRWQTIVLAPVEHPCVTGPALASEGRVRELPIARDGRLDPETLRGAIAGEIERGTPAAQMVVALQLANNETGIVQDVAALSAIAKEAGAFVVCDAVQAAGRIAIDRDALGCDFLMLSSHKLGGPKGIGALIVREGAPLSPLLIGGGQEKRRRAGTENVEAIAGFGAAAQAAATETGQRAHLVAGLRDALESGLRRMSPGLVVVGVDVERLPNTSLVVSPGRRSETTVISLDMAGVAVSSGSACASGKVSRSPVLAAMGFGDDIAQGAVRFSLGWATTQEDIERCLQAWSSIRPADKGSDLTAA